MDRNDKIAFAAREREQERQAYLGKMARDEAIERRRPAYVPPSYESEMADLDLFGAKAECGWKNVDHPVPCTLPSREQGWYCPAHRAMVNGLPNPLGFVGEETEGVAPEVRETRTSSGKAQVDPLAKERAEAMAYIRDYTGRWDFILNLRADRKWGTKWFRLTDRMVEVVLASKAREAQWAAERAPKAETVQTGDPVTEAGWYVKDGAVIKVQVAVHGSGRLYAKRLQVVAGQRGEWVYEPGLIRTLTKADALTAEEAAKMGSVYGVCVVCGAVLTDEESISAGIGPVCSGRLSAQEAAFGL